jgi:hypothetical protein
MMNRKQAIDELFDTMDIAKRNLRGRMLSITSGRNISHAQLEVLFSDRRRARTVAEYSEKNHP